LAVYEKYDHKQDMTSSCLNWKCMSSEFEWNQPHNIQRIGNLVLASFFTFLSPLVIKKDWTWLQLNSFISESWIHKTEAEITRSNKRTINPPLSGQAITSKTVHLFQKPNLCCVINFLWDSNYSLFMNSDHLFSFWNQYLTMIN
jgi:hypothetical protein